MIIGIVADTHDNLPLVDKAVRKLNEEKAELVLHGGDYIAPFVIPHFKALNCELIGVFGNNDGDHELLKKRFAEIGAEIRGKFAEIMADGLKIALLHGEEQELLQAVINSEYYNVVVHGHSHEAKSYRKGETLVVNPGEVCGYLSGKSTLAVLNTQTLDTKIIYIEH